MSEAKCEPGWGEAAQMVSTSIRRAAASGHHNNDEDAKRDGERQRWLEQEGYRVVRFWNSEISADLNAVLEQIYVEIYGSRDAEAVP